MSAKVDQNPLTLTSKLQIQHIGNLDVDHTEKSLVLLSLELALVKDLYSNNASILDRSETSALYPNCSAYMSKFSFQ